MAGQTNNKMMVMACLVALLQISSSAATSYTVGDSSGWEIMSYDSWLSGKSFKVGDTLVFRFTGLHTVTQVSKSDYDSCSPSNPSNPAQTTSPVTISLSTAGNFYYICGISNHCDSGQKLAVTVTDSSTTPTTATSPSSSTTSPPPPPGSSDAIAAASGLAMPFLLMAGVFLL